MDASEPTNAIEAPASTFRFFDLPDELKLRILSYRLVVGNSRSISPLAHNMMAQKALLPLALTSKQMYGLAMQLYYETNTFRAEVTRSIDSHYRPRFTYPNPVVAPRIRKLIVKLDVLKITGRDFGADLDERLQTGGGWRHLLRVEGAPPPPDDAEWLRARELGPTSIPPYSWSIESTRWQQCFDLQECKINLVLVDPEASRCNWRFDYEPVFTARHDVRNARINVKAKRVEIEVKGHKHDRDHPEALCIEKDAQVDEQAIRDLVQKAME